MVSKTPEEWDLMNAEERKAHLAAEEKIVFGEGFQRDRNGKVIEQGIGSPGRFSENHFVALAKAEGPEAAARARAAATKAQAR